MIASAAALSEIAFVLFTRAAAVLYFCRASAAKVERPEFVGFATAAVEAESDNDFFAAASSTAAA